MHFNKLCHEIRSRSVPECTSTNGAMRSEVGVSQNEIRSMSVPECTSTNGAMRSEVGVSQNALHKWCHEIRSRSVP